VRSQVPLPPLPPTKEKLKINVRGRNPIQRRDFVAAALDFYVDGAILPAVDPDVVENVVGGVTRRFGVATPKIDKKLLAEFGVFVDTWLKRNLVPLEPGTDLSVFSWLQKTHYPEWRRKQLDDTWKRNNQTIPHWQSIRERMARCTSFIKREWYSAYKEARCINSRSDWFKCATGPAIHAIEEVVYATIPEFIKHVPVADRPVLIKSIYLPGVKVFTSDHTSFEAHLSSEFMQKCELRLYDYMLQNVEHGRRISKLLTTSLAGINHCRFFDRWQPVDVSLPGTRMSGDMCTSLGNGFSNLMLMLFVCSKKGASCKGFVEGDDGVFSVTGNVPVREDFMPLGFNIKIREDPDPYVADFCGNVFDPDDLVNVPDVLKQLVKFGWSMSEFRFGTPKQRSALLRAKALSALSSWAGCPVLQELSLYVLRHIGSEGPVIYDDSWARDHTNITVKPRPVGIKTRELLERKYGLAVHTQLQIEKWIKQQTRLCPMPSELLTVPPCWTSEWSRVQTHDLGQLRFCRRQVRDV